jgi:methyl-accepting chemotaxis protein
MTRLLRKVSTSAKLAILVVAAMAGLGSLAVDSRAMLEAQLLEERKTEMRSVVEAADAVLHHFGGMETSGVLTTVEAQAQAKALLRGLRYGGKEYVWINDLHPRMVMHPTRPELEGRDVTRDADPTGKLLFQEFVRVVNARGEGYVDYLWPRPDSTRPVRKLSYVLLFQPWGWIVGSGLYLDDVEAALGAQDRRLSMAALVILALLALVAWLVARSVTAPLAEALQLARRIADGDLSLATRPDLPEGADEPARLQEALEQMVRRLRRAVGKLTTSSAAVASASGILGTVVRELSAGAVSSSGGLGRARSSADDVEAALRRHGEAARDTEGTMRRALQEAEELERWARAVPDASRAAATRVVSLVVSLVARAAQQAGDLVQLLEKDLSAARALAEGTRDQARRSGRQAGIVGSLASSTFALAEQAEALERAVEFFRVEGLAGAAEASRELPLLRASA